MIIMTGTVLAGVWMQDPGSLSSGNSQLLTIFVGIAAAALLMLGVAFVVLAVVALKLEKKITLTIDEVKAKAMPVVATVDTMLRDITPKVKVISQNVAETSHMVRDKVQEFDSTLSGVNQTIRDADQKTRAQVGKVDTLVSTTLERTSAIADTIHSSIRTPVREVAGVVNGFKAGLDVLLNNAKNYGGSGRPRP